VLLDPSLRLLAGAGFLQILAITFLTLTPPRQVRREQAALELHGGGH
jgi:type II secretory pathway component PulM